MGNATLTQRTGLPAPGDLFVGRDAELSAVSELLAAAQTRLVTLTGPPGIGKTRLAVACAAACAPRLGWTALFLDLAPVRAPAQVMAELAQALGVEPRGGPEQLIQAAGSEDRLVVLDNFEHVQAAATDLGQLLASCERLRFLVTSRERLRLSAEHEFPVPPLAMPARQDAADLEALAANPSIALLVDRARRISPDFTLTASNAASLASACIRLEGLPLAIELAAARLKVLSPGELVFRLGSRMDVLAGSTRDVPVRQRALRNAIEWSYELLNPAERALFCGLSVFAGRWTLTDADSVCTPADDNVLALVESLLDKSLIRRLPADEQTAQFTMLESLREYASEQLIGQGRLQEMQARHAAHYAALAVQIEASIAQPAEVTWVARISRYDADLRTALDHCLAVGHHSQALYLAAALGLICYLRGDLGNGQAVVDSTLSAATGQPVSPGGDDEVQAGALAAALLVSGTLAAAEGQPDRAQDLLSRALADSEQRGDVRRAAIAAAFLGHVARVRSEWDESARWHGQAAAGFEQLGSTHSMAWAQHDLGLLARDRGDTSRAVTLLRASLRDFRDLGYPWAVAWSAWGLGSALAAQGAVAEARPLLGEALSLYGELDDLRGIAQCLETLADVASELAQYQTAARLIGAAAAARDRFAVLPSAAEQDRISAAEAILTRSLGPEAAERFRQAGRAMPIHEAQELGAAVAQGAGPADAVRARPAQLTRRERQVAALVAAGRTNRQIGRVLGISEKTVEVHLQHVMAKLEVRSRAEVAAWAVTHQLSTPASGGETPRGLPDSPELGDAGQDREQA